MIFWDLLVKKTGQKRSLIYYTFVLLILALPVVMLAVPEPDLSFEAYYQDLTEGKNLLDQIMEPKILVLILFGIIFFVDRLFVQKSVDWTSLVKAYELKEKKDLDLVINSIEFNGYPFGISCGLNIDDTGIYLIPVFIDKFLIKPLYIPWSVLRVTKESWRNEFFGKPFGAEKEIIVIRTKYDPLLQLRINKGELKIDYERDLYDKAVNV